MKLRYKILSGFLLLILMLIIAGSFSIVEFLKISKSVNDLLEDNYRSIDASRKMLEALEREDSGILLLLHDKWTEGSNVIQYGDSLFLASFHVVKNNITEKNEKEYIDSIDARYARYKKTWERPTANLYEGANLAWYYEESHHEFLKIKESVQELMELNQQSMYEEATELKEKAKRAITPGIVAILSAFIFLFIFNYLINCYFISPIEKLTHELENFHTGKDQIVTKINSKDEIKRLKDAINNLITKLKRNS